MFLTFVLFRILKQDRTIFKAVWYLFNCCYGERDMEGENHEDHQILRCLYEKIKLIEKKGI
ncbi:UNVERIFIED_CONTAM: hypothetical protein NCL1_54336 [Trichonephila clavipes]